MISTNPSRVAIVCGNNRYFKPRVVCEKGDEPLAYHSGSTDDPGFHFFGHDRYLHF